MECEEIFPANQETLELLFSKINETNILLKNEVKVLFNIETEKKVVFKLSSINYSLINRTIEINKGYITLFKSNNFICAISLLRIQIENCLRLFGFSIMDNMPNCLDLFLNGTKFKNLTGNNGNNLYDSYLAKEIDKIAPQCHFSETYKQYCEIIHFSGLYQNINNIFENKESGFGLTLYLGGGDNMPHFDILNKIEYTKSLFYSSKIIYRIFNEYRLSTEKVLINY